MIDLFAGPGGLGEGFSAFQPPGAQQGFRIALSIEKEDTAHQTLQLRSFFRQFDLGDVPEEYYEHLRGRLPLEELRKRYPTEWDSVGLEARQAVLGKEKAATVSRWIGSALAGSRTWVLIGGPPCQAYSLVGRSRNRGVVDYVPEKDDRHFLYLEYLRIIADHWPPVFVMENVKGILSSQVSSRRIFEQILLDLRDPARAIRGKRKSRHRYLLRALEPRSGNLTLFDSPQPSDFVVRAEEHGVPQRRHRVIIVGVREDLAARLRDTPRLPRLPQVSLKSAIGSLPRLRSGLSRGTDSREGWRDALVALAGAPWVRNGALDSLPTVRRRLTSALDQFHLPRADRGRTFLPWAKLPQDPDLAAWLHDPRLGGTCNHETRGHVVEDLHRYLFAACFAAETGRSPQLADFPREIVPEHRNAARAREESLFSDRFRVQLSDRPATTITSHISKDGHYYIHWDETQCRSLTVREAARAQTFPDNYFFCGPRTAQYTQVGNAVPPLLARKIARVVHEILSGAGYA